MDPNPLDSLELATRQGQKAPAAGPNPLDALEVATRGQAVNIPDEQNPYKQPWSPQKFMVGMGKAFTEIPEGLAQLGADIFGAQAAKQEGGEDVGQTPGPGAMSSMLGQTSANIGNKVASDTYAYQNSPYGVAKTKSALAGEITGNVLPWLVMPNMAEAPLKAPFLTRLGYGAMNDAYQGGLLGAIKPVQPGQSRAGNTAAFAGGSVIMGGLARTAGEGLKWAAASLPFLRNRTAAYHAGNFLAEQSSP